MNKQEAINVLIEASNELATQRQRQADVAVVDARTIKEAISVFNAAEQDQEENTEG